MKDFWKEKLFLGSIAPLAALACWEYASRAGEGLREFLPLPSQVAGDLWEMLLSGSLLQHLLASLLRVFAGYLIGAGLAVPAGLILGSSRRMQLLFRPAAEMLRPISPIAWIPLAVLWFGIGDVPAVFIITITCFFPMLVASAAAVNSVEPVLKKAAVSLGASRRQLLCAVVLPAALPGIFVGLRVSLGIAWLVIVAAEMVGMRSGLGYLISDSRNMLRIDLVVACMVVIGAAGLALDCAMRRLERVVCPWGLPEQEIS